MDTYCPECKATIKDREIERCPECRNPCSHGGGWPTDQWLGEVVDGGKYYVERLLGIGGFCNVYQVRHTMLEDRVFAMKVLNRAAMGNPRCEELFINESRLLLGFDHPHIVKLHEVGWLENGPAFALMESLQGQDLHQALVDSAAPFPPDRVIWIGAQIASALSSAHSHGVLHRDLKPENVLLLPGDEVRVIDFGIAKVLGAEAADNQLSQFIGTPIYMAPEQFEVGTDVDGRLDIYQLGGLLFTLLTRQTPYRSSDSEGSFAGVIEIAKQQDERAEGPGPRPSERVPELAQIAPALDALVASMLSTRQDNRPATSLIVQEQLEICYDELHANKEYIFSSRQTEKQSSILPLSKSQPSTPKPDELSIHERPTRATPPPEGLGVSRKETEPETAESSEPKAKPAPPKPVQPLVAEPVGLAKATDSISVSLSRALSTSTTRQRLTLLGAGLTIAIIATTTLYALTPPSSSPSEVPEEVGVQSGKGLSKSTVDPAAPEGYVLVQPGTTVLGSPVKEPGREQDESSKFQSTLTRPFLLQRHEVTQKQWFQIMGTRPSYFECDDCPVERVSWFDALHYLNALSSEQKLEPCYRFVACTGESGAGCAEGEQWCQGEHSCEEVSFVGTHCKGYRLPTEAEWEYALRANSRKMRYGDLEKIAWYWSNSDSKTHAICGRESNSWGLCDMLGNVYEWTWDRHGAYPAEDVLDYLGAEEGKFRTTRGCGWNSYIKDCRAAERHRRSPTDRDRVLGFRAARTQLDKDMAKEPDDVQEETPENAPE